MLPTTAFVIAALVVLWAIVKLTLSNWNAALPSIAAILLLSGSACYALQSYLTDQAVLREKAVVDGVLKVTPESRDDTYVSSATCRKCHPGEYATWHETYHRTMTQQALPGNVLGDFDGSTIESDGLNYRVFRRGEEYWAEMPNPDMMLSFARSNGKAPYRLEDIPSCEKQVVMTTGSHHYQTYWVASEQFPGVLETLPLIYLPRQERWIPREAAFMMPPDEDVRMITIWNDHCINCHSTGGVPGVRPPDRKHPHGSFETEVGELGISCEACHGPAQEHVKIHRSIVGRYKNRLDDGDDSTIVNPERLDSKRSSEVCGQCHGVFIRKGEQGFRFAREGVQYRPGDELRDFRKYIEFPQPDSPPEVHRQYKLNRDFYRERWWDDGTMLAGGREFTALQTVGCYLKGEMSCLSCHAMHGADPEAQVLPEMRTNTACTQCHTEAQYTTELSSHTHHASDSSGSSCMNCHMPHTSYALFRAIRSHSISSPRIENSVVHGTPNACNLCHLDRTLDWTQSALVDWYGHEKQELTHDQATIAASLLWMLQGHAAQRAISAWHFGWEPALKTSGEAWGVPFVAQLLADPYGVVRYIAESSLQAMPTDVPDGYDFLAPLSDCRHTASQVVESWESLTAEQPRTEGSTALAERLLNPDGTVDRRTLMHLQNTRDDRPVSIKE